MQVYVSVIQTREVQGLPVKTTGLGVHCQRNLPAVSMLCSFLSGRKFVSILFPVLLLWFGGVFFLQHTKI